MRTNPEVWEVIVLSFIGIFQGDGNVKVTGADREKEKLIANELLRPSDLYALGASCTMNFKLCEPINLPVHKTSHFEACCGERSQCNNMDLVSGDC